MLPQTRTIAALLVLGSWLSAPADAQPRDRTKDVSFYVVQQPIASAFEAIGVLTGTGVQVDPAIDRLVTSVSLKGSREEVFAQLAGRYSLFYWYDGSRYTISSPTNLSRWALPANGVPTSEVEKAIRSVAPHVSQDAIRFDADLRLVYVVGPRELRDAVQTALDNAARSRSDPIQVIKFGQTAR